MPELRGDRRRRFFFPNGIGPEEERKVRGRENSARRMWIGFAYFGLVGWSVVLPILIGVGLGVWLDAGNIGHGWTLSLLLLGAALGCWNAWRMVANEGRRIKRGDDERP